MLLAPVRVVGCGSPGGDDSVGWQAIAALRAVDAARSCAIELHAIATPDRLLDIIDEHGSLVVVDGIVSGVAPGTVFRFAWPDARIVRGSSMSNHGLSVATTLDLAARLRTLPAFVVVYGVECGPAGPGTMCSPAVAAAVPVVAGAIMRELEAR